MSKVAIGLDLSFKTGVAGPDWYALVEAPPKPKELPPYMAYRSIIQRRDKMLDDLFEKVADHHFQIELWVLEGPAMNASQNAHVLYAIWWETYAILAEWGQAVAVVPPQLLKSYAVGYKDPKSKEPHARDKEAMLQAATRLFPHQGSYDNNVADALFLMAMGMDYLGCPVIKAPGRDKALGKVEWPPLETKNP